MAGLDPAIHVFLAAKTWMPGTRPGMTNSLVPLPIAVAFSESSMSADGSSPP
jgi:hypothetical protein